MEAESVVRARRGHSTAAGLIMADQTDNSPGGCSRVKADSSLPIYRVLRDLRRALARDSRAVLQADPGAGKTTAVPPALLDEDWLAGRRIVMLEPRRLAARMAARYMSEALFGEKVGGTVGYTVRMEARVGSKTRIEVVTEGVLTRRIQNDPELTGTGLLIFDEFHERSIQADLGLALALDVQQALRGDLRILLMSATLDVDRVSDFLGGAPVVSCQGRAYPVKTIRLPPRRGEEVLSAAARAVQEAVSQTNGGILAFLPGMREIIRLADRLKGAGYGENLMIQPLHGGLSWEMQKRAVAPAPAGSRKVVLATSIAETSLTIDGIEAVVDTGLMRCPVFDAGNGLTRLVTRRATRDAADQRRGRAGRLGPGYCWQTWGPAEDAMMAPARQPEILTSDLCNLVLEIAAWGVSNPGGLKWLDPPPEAAWHAALQLLSDLGALDGSGAITPHGRRILSLGVTPRLGHMMLVAWANRVPSLGAALAAILEERDLLTANGLGECPGCDIRLRLDVVRRYDRKSPGDARTRRVLDTMRDLQSRLSRLVFGPSGESRSAKDKSMPGTGPAPNDELSGNLAGILVGSAFPDLLARRRPGRRGSYLLACGRGAHLQPGDTLERQEFLAVAGTDGRAEGGRIFLAAPVGLSDVEHLYWHRLVTEDAIEWDAEAGVVRSRRMRKFQALVLTEEPLPEPDPAAVTQAILSGVRETGLQVLPWSKDSIRLRNRIAFMRRTDAEDVGWPDVSDEALRRGLEEWLGPWTGKARRLADLRRLDMCEVLAGMLPAHLSRRLAREAPTHMRVPSGSRIRLDYTGEVPVLPVKLQEMFGQEDTPRVAGGRTKVVVHLLSPAGRPVQVTQDLRSFWQETYFQVRKDLRGRYPKHPWPDDPIRATPTRRTKRKRS